MSEIKDYILYLNNSIEGLDKEIERIILANSGKILNKIKTRLYGRGVDGSGSKIQPNYHISTVQYKKNKNQRISHVTLRDSGDLYNSMFVEYKDSSIFINTSVGYRDELISKYGDSIFDLTEKEQSDFIDTILEPEINKFINKSDIQINIDF